MQCSKCHKPGLPEDAAYCCYCGTRITSPTNKNQKSRCNGTGTVYKRGKRWMAEVTLAYVAGKRKRRTKGGFTTKKEALEYLEILKNGTYIESKTIAAIYEAIWQRDIDKLSESKQTHYKTAYARLEPFHSRNIDTISLPEMQDYIDSLDLTFYPARDIKNLLNKIYDYAVMCNYCTKNYIEYIRLPEKNETSEKVIFTAENINSLWNEYNKTHSEVAGYILIMIYTGMRTGELRNIKTADINFSSGTMFGGIKTKKGKERPILILPIIEPIIKDIISDNRAKLCTISENKFYDSFDELRKKLSFSDDVYPNCSRHTCASALTAANVPPAVIMDILGHTKYQTSLNYTHNTISQMREALENAFDKAV